MSDTTRQAADAISAADAILIGAGAGMGVDSGLPDFRGTQGFWKAYPPYAAAGLRFEQLADPLSFRRDPGIGWGFYGHRLNLYRKTVPHDGFQILRRWAQSKPAGAFLYTSNVDGQFQRAGFSPDRIVECHGSIHHLQCTRPCGGEIWAADAIELAVDESTLRAAEPFPNCPSCGSLARPNILMFGDGSWLESRTREQREKFQDWVDELDLSRLVVVELGAGTAIPSVRWQSESFQSSGATLIRINPREAQGPDGTLSFSCGALAALSEIESLL